MIEWVAVCFGVLDVREAPASEDEFDLLVVPTIPGAPRLLFGVGTDIWLRLVDGPVSDTDLTPEERVIVLEMEQVGIASQDPEASSRVREVKASWMLSALHELVYALISSVATQEEIELIFIKGPTLHAQGLRTREHSGDVDCWVAPGNDLRLARALEPWGWKPAVSAFTGTRVLHSLTLREGEWGCAIDVHSWFPGMTASSESAFRTALATSELREFAGQRARTPELTVNAVISALHDTRPLLGQEPRPEHVLAAAQVLRKAGESTVVTARRVGAEYALRGSLPAAFPHLELNFDHAPIPDDWRWRLSQGIVRVYIEALRLIPWRDRPRILFRVAWPTRESLRASATSLEDGSVSTLRLRVRRALRGLRHLSGSQ